MTAKPAPTLPDTEPTEDDRAMPHDDGLLDSIGKAITAPLRDDPAEDPDLLNIEQLKEKSVDRETP